MNPAVIAAAVVVAYLIGTIPNAIMVARAKGVDITSVGSGNPGASNIGRALGFKYFVLVFVLDALKGLIPAVAMLNDRPVAYLCGAAAILGHVYPVTRRFQGGKGLATGAGVLLALFPVIMPICAVAWFVIQKLSKKAALASVLVVPLAMVLIPVMGGHDVWEFFAFIGIGVVIEIRHVSNIKRLLSGSENTLDFNK